MIDSARFTKHDPFYCDHLWDPQAPCTCEPWVCKNCNQCFNEDRGHECPAKPVLDPRD